MNDSESMPARRGGLIKKREEGKQIGGDGVRQAQLGHSFLNREVRDIAG